MIHKFTIRLKAEFKADAREILQMITNLSNNKAIEIDSVEYWTTKGEEHETNGLHTNTKIS